MTIEILALGHPPQSFEQAWIDEYLKRSQRYQSVGLTRIRLPQRDQASSLPKKALEKIGQKIKPDTHLVTLDAQGDLLNTDQFASLIEGSRTSKGLTFFIGGSYGIPDVVRDRTSRFISLSPLTLPHRLALLILCEQIYRALSYKAGHPYHHS